MEAPKQGSTFQDSPKASEGSLGSYGLGGPFLDFEALGLGDQLEYDLWKKPNIFLMDIYDISIYMDPIY